MELARPSSAELVSDPAELISELKRLEIEAQSIDRWIASEEQGSGVLLTKEHPLIRERANTIELIAAIRMALGRLANH